MHMNILSIETSCDETAISVISATGDFPNATYRVLGNALFSQIELHRQYGGVFPALAKREHIVTVLPMLEKALDDSEILTVGGESLSQVQIEQLETLLVREAGLAEKLVAFHESKGTPNIDLIAVTSGPGLEPALWVGINFAKALATLWNIPVVPVNHMEGHVLASLFSGTEIADIEFPVISLLISGGHTELILMKEWGSYERIGQTRDDAVGEAFDKVARMLGLPYPGGPEISREAEKARTEKLSEFVKLPKPMLTSPDLDFSFSGLKTAVRNAIGEQTLNENDKKALARDFEEVVTEVLLTKTTRAVEQTGAKTIIVGGGVTANTYIRNSFTAHFNKEYPDVAVYFPETTLSTDNSIMIGLAGHAKIKQSQTPAHATLTIKADGNRALGDE